MARTLYPNKICQGCGRSFTGRHNPVTEPKREHFCSTVCRDKANHPPILDRFWSYVDVSAESDACWSWNRGKTTAGYGSLSTRTGHHVYAHRFMWELVNGPIPAGIEVCHRCDNPPCVNPAHLFLGTHKENMADSAQKGRAIPGRLLTSKKLARFSDDDVVLICSLVKSGWTHRRIAAQYGCEHSIITAILTGRRYKRLQSLIVSLLSG